MTLATFLRLRLSTGTIIADNIGQALVKHLELGIELLIIDVSIPLCYHATIIDWKLTFSDQINRAVRKIVLKLFNNVEITGYADRKATDQSLENLCKKPVVQHGFD